MVVLDTYDNRATRSQKSTHSNKTTTWTYDSGGNITSKKEYAYTTGELGAVKQTYTYSYNSTWKDRLDNYNGSPIGFVICFLIIIVIMPLCIPIDCFLLAHRHLFPQKRELPLGPDLTELVTKSDQH